MSPSYRFAQNAGNHSVAKIKTLCLQTHASLRKRSSTAPVQAHSARQNKSSDRTDLKEATSVDLMAVKVLCGIGLREI